MNNDRILASVAVQNDRACCANCGYDLGARDGNWKERAFRKEVALKEAGGVAFDTGYDRVVLRHFYCPGCATLLDTETATQEDPILSDRLTA